jgi:hypothetical protein
MAKKDILYIDAAKFEDRITAAGLEPVMQAGFVQVEAKKGRRVYVAKTKRVGRVDLSGFSVTDAEFGTMAHSAGKFGAVEQELDFRKQEGESDQTAEERILNNFTKILEHMKTLGERVSEKKSGTKAEGTKGEKPKGWSGAGKSKSAKTEAAGTTTGEVNGAPKNDLLESICGIPAVVLVPIPTPPGNAKPPRPNVPAVTFDAFRVPESAPTSVVAVSVPETTASPATVS